MSDLVEKDYNFNFI